MQGIATNLASRMGVSVPTLQRLEAGDPLVVIGIINGIGRHEGLAKQRRRSTTEEP